MQNVKATKNKQKESFKKKSAVKTSSLVFPSIPPLLAFAAIVPICVTGESETH